MAASASAATIVARALRYIRVYGVDESPSAQETSDGADELRSMLGSWSLDSALYSDDLVLPVFADSATAVSMNDAMPDVLAFNLAIRLAPEYGVVPSQDVYRAAAGLLHNWRIKVSNAKRASATRRISDAALLREDWPRAGEA